MRKHFWFVVCGSLLVESKGRRTEAVKGNQKSKIKNQNDKAKIKKLNNTFSSTGSL
jgi:hypothetical protein